jgi:hypothetical protein
MISKNPNKANFPLPLLSSYKIFGASQSRETVPPKTLFVSKNRVFYGKNICTYIEHRQE